MNLRIWELPETISARQYDQFTTLLDKVQEHKYNSNVYNMVVTYPHKVSEYEIHPDKFDVVCGHNVQNYNELLRRLVWTVENFSRELDMSLSAKTGLPNESADD